MEEVRKNVALFPNLVAELARLNMTKVEMADLTGISVASFYGKLKGETEFTLENMEEIRDVLEQKSNQKMALDYLFKKNN